MIELIKGDNVKKLDKDSNLIDLLKADGWTAKEEKPKPVKKKKEGK